MEKLETAEFKKTNGIQKCISGCGCKISNGKVLSEGGEIIMKGKNEEMGEMKGKRREEKGMEEEKQP